jgi:hypothetical protein
MMHRALARLSAVGLFFLMAQIPLTAIEAILVAEETIDTVGNPRNGASPLWCYGSHIMVRARDTLYLSLLRPDEGVPVYCNTHWELWRRDNQGWNEMYRGGEALEREPCPIGLLGEGELVLSIQPKYAPRPFGRGDGEYSWFCQPELLGIDLFETGDNDKVFSNFHPVFPVGSVFREHSYRGFGVDRVNREILLLVLEQTDEHYQPTYLSRDGIWHPLPLLKFPIRGCYPQVSLCDRKAHVLAIGDIVEPVDEWRQAKSEEFNREWDYVFRRLFYAWSPDLEADGFQTPVEIDSVDETAGYILNLDLHVDADDRAHVLYLKMPYQHAFMRDRWFPGEAMTVSLEYVALDKGQVVMRKTLRQGLAEEELSDSQDTMRLNYGRLHPLPDGTLGVVYSGSWSGPDGGTESGLFLSRLATDGDVEETISLSGERPLTGAFFTNTPRGGSDVGNHLDLVGAFSDGDSFEMRYMGYEIKD